MPTGQNIDLAKVAAGERGGACFAARLLTGRVRPDSMALTTDGEQIGGLNFASWDHLSLASHPAVHEAALAALAKHGPHAGGPLGWQGGSLVSQRLEARLAELLCCREVTVFPTGWAAAFGAIQTLAREGDHVLLDCLADSALQHAARGATRNMHQMPHGSTEVMVERLARLRADAPSVGILVLAETVLLPDASVQDLRPLHAACRCHGATLLVRIGHDFGATGDGGFGTLGRQGLLGEVDVLVGSFTSVLATGGGFVAARQAGLRAALLDHASTLSSCALSPVQAAVALAALNIVASAEGQQRRRRLAANVARLRDGLGARAFDVLGEPGGLVPVVLGATATAHRMTDTVLRAGALVNLQEHPAVAHGAARWPLLVMSDHTPDQIDRLIAVAVAAREAASCRAVPRFATHTAMSPIPAKGES